MLNWRELVVTDGNWPDDTPDTLDNVVANNVHYLRRATIRDGRIDDWQGYYISAPDETPDWDTPKCEVDWAGFEDAVRIARQRQED